MVERLSLIAVAVWRGVEFGDAESSAGVGVEPDPGHTAGPSV